MTSLPARLFTEVTYTKPTANSGPGPVIRFIIHDCPSEMHLDLYVRELLARGVTDVIRACEPSYNKLIFEQHGIRVHEMGFVDGSVPPPKIISQLIELCNERFGICRFDGKRRKSSNHVILNNSDSEDASPEPIGGAIAVHCIAGLGRAPLLVAIALIEAGLPAIDAIQLIRSRRRGAFNSVQLKWLEIYRPQKSKISLVGEGISTSRFGMLLNNRIRAMNGGDEVSQPGEKKRFSFFGLKNQL
ncbi:Protein tyrosine phosphatase type IVA 1 [Nowakowskiella sp. JEL0407]|nr:Protein tyrosine phosphatase type IVA 1 [Nowakowskiella sp. JEL0407]